MLIEFKVKNFLSIKEEQTFSMLPAGKVPLKDNPNNVTSKMESTANLNLLKSTIIYGANASGKSSFLKAFSALRYLVVESIDFKLDEEIPTYEPFKLDDESREAPIEFEIDFIANKVRYTYKVIFDKKAFLYESLVFYPKKQPAKLFVREIGGKISYGEYYSGSKKHELFDNQLVLSKAGSTAIESLIAPYRYFSKYFYVHIIHDTHYDQAVIRSFTNFWAEKKDSSFRKNMHKLIKIADTGITDFTLRERNLDEFGLPEDMSEEEKKEIAEKYKYSVKTIHKTYQGKNCIGQMNFDLNEESTGTIKLMVVGGLILDALEDGSTMIIDELDKSLHPLLTRMLIQLFHSEKNNPKGAQLIFATHDVSLIDVDLFRRDQIGLTEKDEYGCTEIYPLSDYTGISKVKPLENWYLRGRFGGIPVINDYELDLEFDQ